MWRVTLVLLAGCVIVRDAEPGDDGDIRYETTTRRNTGKACLVRNDRVSGFDAELQELAVDAGDPLTVLVVFDTCAPACSSGVSSSCETRWSGDTLQVTAETTWRAPAPGQDVACAEICMEWVARCDTELPDDGDAVTLTYAERQRRIALPYDGPVPCVP